MNDNMMKIGIFSFERSKRNYGYDLYKDSEVTNKKTGITTVKPKLLGYNKPLSSIISIIAEHEAFEETKPLYNRFIAAIEEKIESVAHRLTK